jgi:hypothetical protein
MTHPNLEGPRRPGSSWSDADVHDWRLRNGAAEAAAAEIKWPQLLAFDSFIRARLAAVLARRAAERAAEGGLSSNVRAQLWRTRLESRGQQFGAALELEICQPFGLDAISHPPGPPEWWLKDQDMSRICRPSDVKAGFDPDTATWFRDAIGPAAVVVQPHYLSYSYAIHIGAVAFAKHIRAIDIIELPSQLGWLSAQCAPLLWVPAPRPLLDGRARPGVSLAAPATKGTSLPCSSPCSV